MPECKISPEVFDEKNHHFTALGIFGHVTGTETSGTSNFPKLILRLMKVLNVKWTDNGRQKRTTDMNLIRGVSDQNVVFLDEV